RDKLVTGVQTCALPISVLRRRVHGSANAAQRQRTVRGMCFHVTGGVFNLHGTVVGLKLHRHGLGCLNEEVDRPASAFRAGGGDRSEERRVGKEWGTRWA